MEEEKLVTSAMVESDAGPDRRVYTRTARGKSALVEWLAEGPIIGNERRHFLAQIYFLADADDSHRALSFLQDLHSILEARQEQLAAIETSWRAEFGEDYPDNLSDDEFFRHLTFDLGRSIADVYSQWSARSVDRLKDRLAKS